MFVAISSGDYYSHNSNSTKFVIFTDSVQYHVGLLPHTIEGAITCVSYCSLCFLCHFQLFSVERELHRPKRWKLNFIIVASMFIAYSIYNVVAIAGYLQVHVSSVSVQREWVGSMGRWVDPLSTLHVHISHVYKGKQKCVCHLFI